MPYVVTQDAAGNRTTTFVGDQAAETAANANLLLLRTQAQAALATNTTALGLPDPTAGNNTFNAIASPTQAQTLAQVKSLTTQNNALYAQVIALTKQNNKLIRLALGLFDDVS